MAEGVHKSNLIVRSVYMDKKMLFVFNPCAGKSLIKNKLMYILDIFTKAGYEVEVHVTQKALDATDVIAKRGKGKDIIVCSGGDGTLNEAVNGLMQLDDRPCIGYIPAGTTCDFAASHSIPKNMIKAAEIIAKGKCQKIDVGQFADKYFDYVATFGAFTDIPYKTSRKSKALLGHPAYIIEGAKSLMNLKPHYAQVQCEEFEFDGEVFVGMVSNSNQIAGFKGLNGKDSRLDDGEFEVLLLEYSRRPGDFAEMMKALLNPDYKCQFVHRFKTKEIKFAFKEEMDWDIDGEFGGSYREVSILNHRQAMNLVKKIK